VRFSQALAFIILTIVAVALIGGCNNFFTSGDSIASLTVTPVSRLAAVGDKVQFTANGTTVNGDSKDVSSTAKWTASPSTIATIDSTGMATPVAAGNATITASQDSGSATAKLIVTATQLSSIAISPSSPSVLLTQGTEQFTATGTFADGSTKDLTTLVAWTSGTTTTATINSNGLATLIAAGQTTITATVTTSSGDKTGTTTMTVQ